MQGRKQLTPQLFYQLSLDQLVLEDNFYRRINNWLGWGYLNVGQQFIYPKIEVCLKRGKCSYGRQFSPKTRLGNLGCATVTHVSGSGFFSVFLLSCPNVSTVCIIGLCVGCFNFLKSKENNILKFFLGWAATLFCKLWPVCWLVRIGNVLANWCRHFISLFYYPKSYPKTKLVAESNSDFRQSFL